MCPLSWWRTTTEGRRGYQRSEEHTSELQSRSDLVCRLLLEKKKKKTINNRVKEIEGMSTITSKMSRSYFRVGMLMERLTEYQSSDMISRNVCFVEIATTLRV